MFESARAIIIYNMNSGGLQMGEDNAISFSTKVALITTKSVPQFTSSRSIWDFHDKLYVATVIKKTQPTQLPAD